MTQDYAQDSDLRERGIEGPPEDGFVPAGRVIPEWTVGDRIRKVRRMAGLTQSEFADKLQVSKTQIQAWEADHRRPSKSALLLMSIDCEREYGVPAAFLLEGDERLANRTDVHERMAARLRHMKVAGGADPLPDAGDLRSPDAAERLAKAARERARWAHLREDEWATPALANPGDVNAVGGGSMLLLAESDGVCPRQESNLRPFAYKVRGPIVERGLAPVLSLADARGRREQQRRAAS